MSSNSQTPGDQVTEDMRYTVVNGEFTPHRVSQSNEHLCEWIMEEKLRDMEPKHGETTTIKESCRSLSLSSQNVVFGPISERGWPAVSVPSYFENGDWSAGSRTRKPWKMYFGTDEATLKSSAVDAEKKWDLEEVRAVMDKNLLSSDMQATMSSILTPGHLADFGAAMHIPMQHPGLTVKYGVDTHPLKDIFPYEQYDKVREKMSHRLREMETNFGQRLTHYAHGLAVTIFGADVQEFVKRSINPEAWRLQNPGRVLHLLLMTNKDNGPKAEVRKNRPDIHPVGLRGKFVRYETYWTHVNSGSAMECFFNDDRWSKQLPGKWARYDRASELLDKAQLRRLHNLTARNRQIFAHSSDNNRRENMIKLDTDRDLLVEWIRPFPSIDNRHDNQPFEAVQAPQRTRRGLIDNGLHHNAPMGFYFYEDACDIQETKRQQNFYQFIHEHKTEEAIECHLPEMFPKIEYLNLHEPLLHIRTATLRRKTDSWSDMGPFTPASYPHPDATHDHYARISMQYVIHDLEKSNLRAFEDSDERWNWLPPFVAEPGRWPKRGWNTSYPYNGVEFEAKFKLWDCCQICPPGQNQLIGGCCDCTQPSSSHVLPPTTREDSLSYLRLKPEWSEASTSSVSQTPVRPFFSPVPRKLFWYIPMKEDEDFVVVDTPVLRLRGPPLPDDWQAYLLSAGRVIFASNDNDCRGRLEDPRFED